MKSTNSQVELGEKIQQSTEHCTVLRSSAAWRYGVIKVPQSSFHGFRLLSAAKLSICLQRLETPKEKMNNWVGKV